MKSAFIAALLTLSGLHSHAQGGGGMYGITAGIGATTAYKPKMTLAAEGFFLKKITPHVYLGGMVAFEKYSFTSEYSIDAASITYGDIVSIKQKSAYAFIGPKLDVGIGYRKYVHAHLSAGPGFYMGGQQRTYEHQPYWTAGGLPFGHDTVGVNTGVNIPAVIMRIGIGVSERIPTGGHWNIMLTQQVSMLPGDISKHTPSLQTGYFSFQIGIMHKYPLRFVEY